MTEQRRIIQIVPLTDDGEPYIVVLCNDGTLWEIGGGVWHPWTPIPQPHPAASPG